MTRVQPSAPSGANSPSRAAARAAQRRKRSLILLGVVILLVVALVAVVGVIFVRGAAGREPDSAAEAPAEAAACLPSELQITADPAIAGALEAIVADVTSGADCPEVTITAEDSAVTTEALAAGTAPTFDVWVPDSAMWPARAAGVAQLMGVDASALTVGDTVATTPVVLAATEGTASALGSAGGVALSGLAGGAISAVLPDPSTVASSSAALLALQTAVGGDARVFTAITLGLAAGAVPAVTDALSAAAAATSPTVAVATEQAVLQHNASGTELVPIYPTDVQPAIAVPLVTLTDASAETVDAVAALADAIAKGGEQLAEFGWRDASGDSASADEEDAGAASVPVDAANQAEALRTWQVLTAPSRMLSLNDVSGSMNQPGGNGMTRIDLFEQAAVQAINSLSADSSLATWVFSSRRIGGQDWQEIDPFGSLGDPAHKQRVIDTANRLDSLVGGGTGLYDSVYAAVKYMRDTYVPGQVNLILLNTDGYNEDDAGLDLQGLLAELEKLHDPAKPVAVIAIGYGPDTDQAALEQIAAATDGAAYQALQPTDIGRVLVDAVTQRGCRPNCG